MKITVTDPTILTCLESIRKGDAAAVGVLADYLEENNLPRAKALRRIWESCCNSIAYWMTANLDRRRFARWEAIAWCRKYARTRVRNLYKRKWKSLPLKKHI